MAKPQAVSPETLLAALAERRGMTAAELADAVGIGQSTSAKHLAALEAAGTVERTPGGRSETGRRVADRWSITGNAPTPDTTALNPAGAAPSGAVNGNEVALTDSVGRLGRGVLGSLVLEYLAGRPTEAFGPSALAKALGRSAGAISNSLDAMAIRGQVDLVADKPRRYRITTAK
jgi:DNA-binding transcriptional ArsR family regulator